jgi:hypothetical protein
MYTSYSDLKISRTATIKLLGEKIAQYANCDPQCYLQLDGVFSSEFQRDTPVDCEGDFLTASHTVELMKVPTVRVLIPESTDPMIASRQLMKMAKLLSTKPQLMEYASPLTEYSQQYEEEFYW